MERTLFEERLRRRPQVAVERRARAVALHRVLEHVGVTLDQVVNDAAVKAEVLRWYRVLDACVWQGRRRHLAQRAALEQWMRENR